MYKLFLLVALAVTVSAAPVLLPRDLFSNELQPRAAVCPDNSYPVNGQCPTYTNCAFLWCTTEAAPGKSTWFQSSSANQPVNGGAANNGQPNNNAGQGNNNNGNNQGGNGAQQQGGNNQGGQAAQAQELNEEVSLPSPWARLGAAALEAAETEK